MLCATGAPCPPLPPARPPPCAQATIAKAGEFVQKVLADQAVRESVLELVLKVRDYAPSQNYAGWLRCAISEPPDSTPKQQLSQVSG